VKKEDKISALELAMKQINKEYGANSVMKLGDDNFRKDIDTIPTGSFSLDRALGIGGIPKGRITEIYGPEGSGKTTLCLSILSNAQKNDDICAFVDTEHSLDPAYAAKLGVESDELIISQPNNGEQALQIVEALIRSGGVDVVVVDSVAALVPAAEIEGQMGDSHMGLQARLMSQAMRKLAGIVHGSNTCLIFTNQIRMKIGVMYGNPETQPGGNALKFYSSIRLDIRRITPIKSGDEIIGSMTKVKVVKNKVATPFKVVEFPIYFGEGIDFEADILACAQKAGLLEKKGAWFSFEGEHVGQGIEKARKNLKENLILRTSIYDKLKNHFGLE